MKTNLTKLSKVITAISLVILTVAFISCKNKRQAVYERLMNHANSIKVIDTHEHQIKTSMLGVKKYNLWELIERSYLHADLISAGSPPISDENVDNYSLDKLWDTYGKYLDYCRNTSYYKQLNYGFQKLYDFNSPVFNKENVKALSSKIAENYKNYDTWFKKAFEKENFRIMFVDQYWNPYNFILDTNYFRVAFHINDIVDGVSDGSQDNFKNKPFNHEFYNVAKKENLKITNLDEYLAFTDHLIKEAMKNKAVCLKNSMAYGRTIEYENITYERANEIFKKAPAITGAENKALQDFMFHWLIKKGIEYNLPIQIHTGYLAGNGNTLDNGVPTKLNNLFSLYPKAKFIMFHGGYPWTSEYVALAKMFPNVYLDLVWLPQISESVAIRTFDEMLDCVPYNKYFWGGDCHFIEEAVGSLTIGKEAVVKVLANRVVKGRMTEEMACEILDRVFRQNAIEVFNLKLK